MSSEFIAAINSTYTTAVKTALSSALFIIIVLVVYSLFIKNRKYNWVFLFLVMAIIFISSLILAMLATSNLYDGVIL